MSFVTGSGIGGSSWQLLTQAVLLLAACSGSESEPANRAAVGQWCGVPVNSPGECIGDEVHFVELMESAGQLSGRSCEAYDKDCYPMLGPTLDGSRLTYAYEFSGYRVDADFTLSSDVTTLAGVFFSTKCACAVAVTLYRI